MLRKKFDKQLGEVLVESKLITRQHLDEALKKQKRNGQFLSRNLIDMGCADEVEITRCIAERYRVPYIPLDSYKVDRNLLRVIPKKLSERHGIIPLDLLGDILTVGIVEVPDKTIIDRLQRATGLKIQVMMVTAGDFSRHMQNVYHIPMVNSHKGINKIGVKNRIKKPAYKGKERRRFPRFVKGLKVKYEFRAEYNINSSVNISQGGILIRSKSPAPVNAHIAIRIALPNSPDEIIVVSRVTRVEKERGTYLVALDFSSISAQDSKRLADFFAFLES